MEATNKGEDSMDKEAIKAEAQKLGLPTAEEMYLFAERMNGFRHSDLLEASQAGCRPCRLRTTQRIC